jgi:hypothetical protein
MKTLFCAVLISLIVLVGCAQGTQGNLEWTGVSQLPASQSKNPSAPVSIAPITPEQAERINSSGPALVSCAPNGVCAYQTYPPGDNHCAEDLKKILAARAANGAIESAPYCANVEVNGYSRATPNGVVQ